MAYLRRLMSCLCGFSMYVEKEGEIVCPDCCRLMKEIADEVED